MQKSAQRSISSFIYSAFALIVFIVFPSPADWDSSRFRVHAQSAAYANCVATAEQLSRESISGHYAAYQQALSDSMFWRTTILRGYRLTNVAAIRAAGLIPSPGHRAAAIAGLRFAYQEDVDYTNQYYDQQDAQSFRDYSARLSAANRTLSANLTSCALDQQSRQQEEESSNNNNEGSGSGGGGGDLPETEPDPNEVADLIHEINTPKTSVTVTQVSNGGGSGSSGTQCDSTENEDGSTEIDCGG